MLGEIATQHSHINPPSTNKKGVKPERSSICAQPAEERLPEKRTFCAMNIHTLARNNIGVLSVGKRLPRKETWWGIVMYTLVRVHISVLSVGSCSLAKQAF